MNTDPEIYALIGLALVISAIVAHFNTRKFLKNSEKTDGVVESIGTKTVTTSSVKTLVAIIKYNVNGKNFKFDSTISRFQKLREGNHVEILYSKSEPYNAQINYFFKLYLVEIVLLILGAAFLVHFYQIQ